MNLNADLFRTVRLQKTDRLLTVAEHRMGRVLNDHDLFFMRESNQLVEKLQRSELPGRTVRIIHDQELRLFQYVVRNRLQIGIKIVCGQERKLINRPAVVARMRSGDRIPRNGHERDVPRIDKSVGNHRQRGFRPDAMVDLRGRVEFHAETPLHESGGRLFIFQAAVIGVTAIFELFDFRSHHLPNRRIGPFVVFSDSKVEQMPVRKIGESLALRPFDFFKFINFRTFSVVDAADPFGEQLLKIGFTHASLFRSFDALLGAL